MEGVTKDLPKKIDKLYRNLTKDYKNPIHRYFRNVLFYGTLFAIPTAYIFGKYRKTGLLFSYALFAGYNQIYLTKYLRSFK
jgi:hypothetical protein